MYGVDGLIGLLTPDQSTSWPFLQSLCNSHTFGTTYIAALTS